MFVSYSLYVSIVKLFTLRQKRVHGGRAFADGNRAPLLDNTCCWYEYPIDSVPRMARPYTILSAACQTHTRTHTRTHARTHAVYIELDGGSEAGREGLGRSEEGWRVGGRVGGREQGEGGRDGGNKGRERGSDDARQRKWMKGRIVEGGRVEGGRVEGGNERGRDRARARGEGGSERGVRERGRERAAERGREGNFKGGTLGRTLPSIRHTAHKTTLNAVLASDTLVLDIKKCERVYKLCIVMRRNVLFHRWTT